MNKVDKTTSNRPLRFANMVKRALSEIFLRGEVYHPSLQGNTVLVSDVRITPDLRNISVFILVNSFSKKNKEIADILNGLIWQIRPPLLRQVRFKYAPEIRFFADKGMREADYEDHMHALINKVASNGEPSSS